MRHFIKDFNGSKPKVNPSTHISENAVLIGSVKLAAGVSIWPGCVLRADVDEIAIGDDTNIQDGVLIHTNYGMPCVVGRGTTIGHGAILHGCTIGDNCLIGMGAIVLDGAVIENDCIVGAGAVITEGAKVSGRSLVLGVPGRTVRAVTDDEVARNGESALDYKKLARLHTGKGRLFEKNKRAV